MEKWSVTLRDGRKITVEIKKTPSKKLEELRRRHEKTRFLIETAKSTGKWWEAWQREEIIKSLEEERILDIVKKAIEGLKKIYTPDWFKKAENESHPMWHTLIYPALTDNPIENNPLVLLEFITLGYSAEVLGELDPNLVEDLRRKENFYSRAFELRIKAFLKSLDPPAILEEELIDRVHKVPDARWIHYDFEIKSLEESEFDKRVGMAQEKIREELKKIFDSIGFVGHIVYDIKIGTIRSSKELEDRVNLIINLIHSLKNQILDSVKEEKECIRINKNEIQIEIHFIKSNHSSILGSLCITDPFPLEFRRISRVVDDACEKVKDKPLIVIISTPKLLEFYLFNEIIRIAASYFIFSPYLTPKDEKIVEEINNFLMSLMVSGRIIESSVIQEIEQIKRKTEKLEKKVIEKFEKLRKIKEIWLYTHIPIFEAREIIRRTPIFFVAIVIENPFYGLSFEEIIEKNKEVRKLFEEKWKKIIKEEEFVSTPKMVIGVPGKFIYVSPNNKEN